MINKNHPNKFSVLVIVKNKEVRRLLLMLFNFTIKSNFKVFTFLSSYYYSITTGLVLMLTSNIVISITMNPRE